MVEIGTVAQSSDLCQANTMSHVRSTIYSYIKVNCMVGESDEVVITRPITDPWSNNQYYQELS